MKTPRRTIRRTIRRTALVVAASLSATAFAGAPALAAATASTDVRDVVLNVGADASQRNLGWLSSKAADQCVEYAPKSGGALFNRRTTKVKAYASGKATPTGYTYFHATMADLRPSSEYLYRLGDCASDWTVPYDFKTQDNGSFNFFVFGDPQLYVATGGTNPGGGWANTLRRATSMFPGTDFMITAGDQVNAYVDADQTPEWDLFFAPTQLQQIALAPTTGNHDNARNTGVQYGQHMALPHLDPATATAAGNGDYWYTYNGVLFLDLNSNSLDIAAHESFMKKAIAANPHARWTIATFHHAPFSSADHTADADVVSLRSNLTPVLSKLRVDLVLNGHDHDYARSYLMDGAKVVAGTGASVLRAKPGQVLYIATNSASGGKFYPLTGPYPWTAKTNQEGTANFTNVAVVGGSIVVTTYRASDGSVVDRVTLTRDAAAKK